MVICSRSQSGTRVFTFYCARATMLPGTMRDFPVKWLFLLLHVSDCCSRLGMCRKASNHDLSSYPSMVQINVYQTCEYSAFTLFKRRDPPKPPMRARPALLTSSMTTPISAFQTSEYSAFTLFRNPQRLYTTSRSTSGIIPYIGCESNAYVYRFDPNFGTRIPPPASAPLTKDHGMSEVDKTRALSREKQAATVPAERPKARDEKKRTCRICGKVFARLSTLRVSRARKCTCYGLWFCYLLLGIWGVSERVMKFISFLTPISTL